MRDRNEGRRLRARERARQQREIVRLKILTQGRRRSGPVRVGTHPLSWLQDIADKLNEHRNHAWNTPRDMIFDLLKGNPLRKALANYISADPRWQWLKRCTVCGDWFPAFKGERCSRACTDQWWSRGRRNALPSARRRR